MKLINYWALQALLTCGMAAYCMAQTKPAPTKPLKQAADFTLSDATGKVVKLSAYKGKVVLLNFWATWCGPCKIEIPWFIEFDQKYKSQGFAVLGIAMDDEGWDAVRPHLAKNKIPYSIMIGNEALADKYGGVESMPTSFIIDREGRIVTMHVGLVSKKDYSDDIEKLLAKPGSPVKRSAVGQPSAIGTK